MLKTSLWFLAIAVVASAFADLAVTTVHPWQELGRMSAGLLHPQWHVLLEYRQALLMTLVFAFCGTALGVTGGAVLAIGFHLAPIRLFCAGLRSVHELFWAFLFLPLLGLTPACGVLAIAVPYAGVFAKVFAEIRQEANPRVLAGLPRGAGALSRFCYGVWPVIYPSVRNYTSYRFECALRSAAVLGFIGLPTMGYHLETAFREGLYGEAAALLLSFYLLIASLRLWLKPRWVPLYLLAAIVLIPKDVQVTWSNLVRLFTYEMLPWPIRREGVNDGTLALHFPLSDLWAWFAKLFHQQILPGLWQTMVLTQIVLVGSGLVALVLAFLASRKLQGPWRSRLGASISIVLRTTPEYIMAYVFVHLLGPSMLPAVLALSLHNGGILGILSAREADHLNLRPDAPKRALDRMCYEILPRTYGQFLAFLFYRWEVMMRESAILGILGVTTLGFYIDSAIAEDKMDRAAVIIAVTALLNMLIDTLSQRLRGRLRLSSHLTADSAERLA